MNDLACEDKAYRYIIKKYPEYNYDPWGTIIKLIPLAGQNNSNGKIIKDIMYAICFYVEMNISKWEEIANLSYQYGINDLYDYALKMAYKMPIKEDEDEEEDEIIQEEDMYPNTPEQGTGIDKWSEDSNSYMDSKWDREIVYDDTESPYIF